MACPKRGRSSYCSRHVAAVSSGLCDPCMVYRESSVPWSQQALIKRASLPLTLSWQGLLLKLSSEELCCLVLPAGAQTAGWGLHSGNSSPGAHTTKTQNTCPAVWEVGCSSPERCSAWVPSAAWWAGKPTTGSDLPQGLGLGALSGPRGREANGVEGTCVPKSVLGGQGSREPRQGCLAFQAPDVSESACLLQPP